MWVVGWELLSCAKQKNMGKEIRSSTGLEHWPFALFSLESNHLCSSLTVIILSYFMYSVFLTAVHTWFFLPHMSVLRCDGLGNCQCTQPLAQWRLEIGIIYNQQPSSMYCVNCYFVVLFYCFLFEFVFCFIGLLSNFTDILHVTQQERSIPLVATSWLFMLFVNSNMSKHPHFCQL